MDDDIKTCKYCGKTFTLDHIYTRHEQSQCPKKHRSKDRSPDNANVVKNARTLLSKQEKELEQELKQNKQNKQNISALKSSIDESKRMHDLTIDLKNTNKAYIFHCIHCNEGFEFEREQINHQKLCIRRDKTKDIPNSPVKTKISINKSKRPTINELQKNIISLKNIIEEQQKEIELQKREITHVQKNYKKIRKEIELVRNVKEQLKQLNDVKFQLRLFSTATLRQGQGQGQGQGQKTTHSPT